ncbi:MAG: O-antigen ligase family protein [Desmonostoc vinosum HA7617-LM4]|jgi:hypothetical protein|nr:O-antigen ligase family protein [Desmonostoc vinosum HA7617-LM4]
MQLYEIFLSLTIIFSGLADAWRLLSLGSITALGILTILSAVATWILLSARRKLPKAVLVVSGLVLFILQALINWVWYLPTGSLPFVNAVQNVSVLAAFVGLILLSTIQSYRTPGSPKFISDALTKATQLSAVLYGLSILITGPSAKIIMSPRSFALFAIVGVAWYVAAWRYRLPKALWWLGLIIVDIALSFSRTALLISLILIPLSQISLTSIKSWVRIGLTLVLIVTVSYLAFNYVEPIRSRFSDVGDNATVGGVKVNTSGRNQAWPIAYASALESPWIGKGPGSVGIVLVKRVGPTFPHPHNDYLRILHDYGFIGLTIWIFGYGQLITKTWQNWKWADRNDIKNSRIHLAAFLALAAVALAMITDNVIVYIFVMAPLGVLVGASLGSASFSKKLIHQSTRNLPLVSDMNKLAIKL